MADYLYEQGIIINILHRLPVKTILRCTSVCKSWYFLIKNPQFISSHLKFNSSRENHTPLILLRRRLRGYERYRLYSDDESFTRQKTIDLPFRSINSYFTIVGSCNGLLCLSDDRVYYIHTIILWNPCIKKSILVPKPGLIYNSYGTFIQCLGFGFDSVTNDHKVVRITYLDYGQCPARVELYKLSTGVWHDMSYLSLEYFINNKSRKAYTNKATHWIANYMDRYDLIVLFDMCREVFREIILPDDLAIVDSNISKDLIIYMNSLALVMWDVSIVGSGFCVWVMEVYGVRESWIKMFAFDPRGFGGGVMRPLWVRGNREVVMVMKDGRLISYDVNGGEVKDLGVCGSRCDDYRHSIHVESYVRSLVLLEMGSCFCDKVTCNELPALVRDDCGSVDSYGSDCEQNSGYTSAK